MNKVVKSQVCVLLKNRLEIWIDSSRKEKLIELINSGVDMIDIDGTTVSRYEISGIYNPDELGEIKKLYNGKWKCKQGKFHKRYEECNHVDPETARQAEKKYKEMVDKLTID